LQRLKEVAAAVPADIQVAVEFRHDSWFAEDTYAVLRAAKWAMVATHNHDRGDSPIVDTGAGFFYARLHGAVGQYIGDYGVDAMRRWAGHVAKFLEKNLGAPVYIFLNMLDTNGDGHVDLNELEVLLDVGNKTDKKEVAKWKAVVTQKHHNAVAGTGEAADPAKVRMTLADFQHFMEEYTGGSEDKLTVIAETVQDEVSAKYDQYLRRRRSTRSST